MKHDKKFIIFGGILLVASGCFLVSFIPDSKEESKDDLMFGKGNEQSKESGNVASFEKSYQVKHLDVDVRGVQTHIRTVGEKSSFPVLLLHGEAFDSGTWETLGTLKVLAQAGFYGVAVDLPSHGKSKPLNSDLTPEKFLENLIHTLELHKPVIVSPSMSGMYSIPFVLSMPQKVSGYVPVAPVIKSEFKIEDFKKCNVSTLSIYGENDAGAAAKNDLLKSIPNSRVEMIPDGKHPCYLDDPKLFHKLLVEFIKQLK